jgi:hypothetical protein
MNCREKRPRSSHSPSDGSSRSSSSRARAWRWKRLTSASILWKRGDTMCERVANRPLGLVLEYSKPPRPSLTPKLI